MSKLEQYELIPRQILRLVLRSYDLRFKEYPNLFSAMIAECDGKDEHNIQVDPSTLHQRQVQVLGVYEDREENCRLAVGPVEGGLRFAFGPVKDRKRAMDYLVDLADLLGEKMTRNGMLVSSQNKEIVLNLLRGNLQEFQRKIERSLLTLKILFWKRTALFEQQRLLNVIGMLKNFSQDGTTLWKSIDQTHGFIAVPDGDLNKWQVYSVLAGIPVSMEVVSGEWKNELTANIKSRKLPHELQKKIEKHKQNQVYSSNDLGKINAVVWWLQYGRAKDHGHFLPIQELISK